MFMAQFDKIVYLLQFILLIFLVVLASAVWQIQELQLWDLTDYQILKPNEQEPIKDEFITKARKNENTKK